MNESEFGIWPFGELIQYCCVIAVADELHFTRAARRLHLDQSAVSRHVQKLEATLGVKLFNRGSRGVELTEAGAAFALRARKALRNAREATTIATAIGNGEPQQLEVVYSTLVDLHAVAEIKRIAEKYMSGTVVRFRSVESDEVTEYLWEGRAHAALDLLPVGPDLSQRRLFREELLAALPDSLRSGRSRTIPLGCLKDLPIIWPFGLQSPASTQILSVFRDAGFNPRIILQAHSTSEALASAREGFGITFVKASDLHLRPKGIKFRQIAGHRLHVETGVVYVAEPRWNSLNRLLTLMGDHFSSADYVARRLTRAEAEPVRKKPIASQSGRLREGRCESNIR